MGDPGCDGLSVCQGRADYHRLCHGRAGKAGPQVPPRPPPGQGQAVQAPLLDHKGTYADDCIVSRVMAHKCYIVATQDKDLKRRIRKIPGVPIMYISRHKYNIERMPNAMGAWGF